MARDFSDLVLTEAPDASVITLKEGTVVYWTNGAETLFSYKPSELHGELVEMFRFGPLLSARD